MSRSSDVRLELGFHCVVNRSQKNIDEEMSREDLWAKERKIFTKNERMKRLPEKNWGTLRLMEKVAKIQEARVDECLPKIKESVRRKMGELQAELREVPPQPETGADKSRLLNRLVSQIRDDLARRIRAEFMSAEPSDRHLTIAPIVASMVQNFKSQLLKKNPNWLGEAMIEEVDYTVQTFVTGYTVDNLTGPQVFNNLIKQTFIDEGLLKRSVHGLVTDVGEHLRSVVMHVIEVHANNYPILSNRLDAKAEECIDQLAAKTRDVCGMLAEAEEVTSTTYGQYTVKLTEFRKSWLQDPEDGGTDTLATALRGAEGQSEVPVEFLTLVEEAQEEPRKLATLEICASLHVYTGLMIEGFVESSAKLVKFFMMLQLADQLEAIWRGDLGALDELFPTDQTLALKKEDLTRKIDELSGFKARETGTPSVLRNIGIVLKQRMVKIKAPTSSSRTAYIYIYSSMSSLFPI